MFICKHCKKEFLGLSTANKANHSRWCLENPKRDSYKIASGNIGLNSPESILKRSISIKKAWSDGKYDNIINRGNHGYRHTEQSKENISRKALASKHRRLVRSIREYVARDGRKIMLDSSWEEALAIRLDELNINWIRPEIPIPYTTIDGKTHNYFPDFYLPDFDLYIDPKNPAAMNAQAEKIAIITKIMPNLIILGSLMGCKNFLPDAPS